MNEYEKSLISLTREELGEEEYGRINQLVAQTKRFVELYLLLPQTKAEFEQDETGYLAAHGLDLLLPDDMKLLVYANRQEELKDIVTAEDALDRVPESIFRFRQFVGNKIYMRDKMRDELCVPNHPKVKKWRAQQIERSKGCLGGINPGFVHDVMNYELTVGCSVGCKFCGVGAMKLQKVFKATEENQKLFRKVLEISHEIIGDAAGKGTMYLATEPLDNADYEVFEKLFFEEYDIIPQITTAVPLRDVERTHKLVGELYEKKGFIHRFSVRSLEQAQEILTEFTPEELIKVELIPQYPEAPGFVPFAVAGKQRDEISKEEAKQSQSPGSICCVDGFVVNMAEQSIKLITACHSSEQNPEGVAGPEKVFFKDAEDYREKLLDIIETKMMTQVPKNNKLKVYSYLQREQTKQGEALVSQYGGYTLYIDKIPYEGAKDALELLLEGIYTKDEIVEKLISEKQLKPEMAFWNLAQFWKFGIIADPILFPWEYAEEGSL